MMEHKLENTLVVPASAGGPAEAGTTNNQCGNRVGRRTFFQWLTYGLSAVAAAVLGVPLIGYFVGVRKREVRWVTLDEVDRFPVNETRLKTFDNPLRQPWDGMTALTGVYVRNLGADEQGKSQFLVFAVNCAHLGCPVSWFPQSGLFMCPCHGGVYYANGDRASGPPPRGLFRCVWRVRDGRLEIQAPHYPTLQDPLASANNNDSALPLAASRSQRTSEREATSGKEEPT